VSSERRRTQSATPADRHPSRGSPDLPRAHRVSPPNRQKDIALIDLLDRLLDGGVVLAGDITLAVADVDLVYVGLRALVSSVAAAERAGVRLP
jgi:Gas vesicle protein